MNVAASGSGAGTSDGASQTIVYSDPETGQSHTISDPQFVADKSDVGPLGTLMATPLSGQNGQVAVTYTVDDGDLAFLARGQQAHETYQFTITDSQGAATTETVTVTLTGGDHAPVATNDAYSIAENNTLSVDVGGRRAGQR